MTEAANVIVQNQQRLNGQNTDAFNLIAQTADSIADVTSSKQFNPTARGLILIVTLADKQGTVGFTPNIRTYDASGTAHIIYTAAELTANGTTIYTLHPDTVSGMAGTEASIVLPRVWDLLMDLTTGAGAGNSFDIKVDAMYLI